MNAYTLHVGNSAEVLKTLADNSIDSVVCDPPYGINFLGKSWDTNTGEEEVYRQCLRVLKPGGHILAFSAARTYHHLAMTLERVGFDIRDQLMWIYSSGFPKSQDIGRQIQKSITGKPDKQRFDPAIMIKVAGDQYRHPENNKIYRKLPDINGDRLKKSHEGEGYGSVFEEVMDIKKQINPKASKATFNNVLSEAQNKQRDNSSDNSKPGTAEQIVCVDPQAQKWSGWGTALKPAHEPICLARKPLKQSIAKNVQQYGTGALNIDATRVPYEDADDIETYLNNKRGPMERSTTTDGENLDMFEGKVGYKTIKRKVNIEQDLPEQGRFPSNVIGEIQEPYQKYFYSPKADHQERKSSKPKSQDSRSLVERIGGGIENKDCTFDSIYEPSDLGRFPSNVVGEIADGYQKYFYCPKVSRHERHVGFELPPPMFGNVQGCYDPETGERFAVGFDAAEHKGNNHPTVKPVALMEYLIKLVTPPGGTVLDPFNGSGSTGMAAVGLGFKYIGCDLDPHYIDITRRRIDAWVSSKNQPKPKKDEKSATRFNQFFSDK